MALRPLALQQPFALKSGKQKRSEKARLSRFNWDDYSEIRTLKTKRPQLKFLSRLTVPLEEHSQLHQLSSDDVLSYDILAVQPTTDKLFHQACTSLAIDVISLDMTNRLPFFLKFPTVNAAIERGIHFEIVYSHAIRDNTLRRYLISNALELVTFTKGKNVFISSGAENPMDFRGPYDLVNLGLLFDLKEEQSKAAVSTNCRAILFHSESRKGSWRSVVSGKPLSSLSNEDSWLLKRDDIIESAGGEGNGCEKGVTDDEDGSDNEVDDKKLTKESGEEKCGIGGSDDDHFEPEMKKAKV